MYEYNPLNLLIKAMNIIDDYRLLLKGTPRKSEEELEELYNELDKESRIAFGIDREGIETDVRPEQKVIISKLWKAVYDLLHVVKGDSDKTLEDVESYLDVIEYDCRFI